MSHSSPGQGRVRRTTGTWAAVAGLLAIGLLRRLKVAEERDATLPCDYHADAGDRGVQEVLEPGTASSTG